MRGQQAPIDAVECGWDVGERAPDVGRDQVQHRSRQRSEAANAEVEIEDQNRDAHTGEQVAQVIAQLGQLRVSLLRFVVERGELFVGGFQFLLGRL